MVSERFLSPILSLFRFGRTAGKLSLCFVLPFFFFSALSGLKSEGFIGYSPGVYDPSLQESDGVWRETFEQDGISWVPLYQEPDVKMTFQQRTGTEPHSGEKSEEIVLEFPSSGFAFLGHYADYPILFNETAPSVWIRATKPGISLGVLAVLPETKRTDTGTPLTLLLPGGTYRQTGEWEELRFEKDLGSLLDETIEAVRAEHRIKIDTKNAYIRQVVLFTEQEEGAVRLWVDDLVIDGHATLDLQTLEESERNGIFDPVNLLAFRFRVTNSPIVIQAASDKLRRWPTEPFAVGSEKMKNWIQERLQKEAQVPKFVSIYSNQKKESEIASSVGENPAIESVDFDGEHPAGISTAEYLDSSDRDETSPLILGSGTRLASADFTGGSPGGTGTPSITFSGGVLKIDDEPIVVRAVEYQGEPLAFLKRLQFNAVWLKEPPKSALLEEARREDMWLIAPPPVGNETVGSIGGPSGNAAYFNGTAVPDAYNKVLIWYIGNNLTNAQFDGVADKVRSITNYDQSHRPVAGHVRTGLFSYSDGVLDLLIVNRKPLLTSLDMVDYRKWLQLYPNLMKVGTPLWNEIQTQPDPLLAAQCRSFGATDEMPSLISYEQMRQQVRISLAANAHGFLFSSDSPLNAEDHETQYRACALELINMELMLIDSWIAGSSSGTCIETNQKDISAVMLQTGATSLLLPVSEEPNTQLVFGCGAANSDSLVAPASEGVSADLLLPGNLRTVPSHRRAGGIDMSLDEVSMNSLLFLFREDWYARVVTVRSASFGKRMAELAIRLAKMRLDTYRDTVSRIASLEDTGEMPRVHHRPLVTIPNDSLIVDSACRELTLAESELSSGDEAEAYLQAERALREIRMTERRLWQIGTRFDKCLPVLPVSISFSMLPEYISAYNKIASRQVKQTGENLLNGGDMENIESWSDKTWSKTMTQFSGVVCSLNSDTNLKHSGNTGLVFKVTPESTGSDQQDSSALGVMEKILPNNGVPLLTEVPPIKVEATVNVHTDELVCVQGWIWIESKLPDGSDGFMIYDSHGGEALAQRYYITNGWFQFAFYRVAEHDGDMKITFALSTYGRVCLDDVSVYQVK